MRTIKRRKNIILGAGLAGLSVAYHLAEEYEMYEKETKVGGLCRSLSINEFTFDYGPHILYSVDRYASKLIQRLLQSNLRIKEREAWIYHYKFDCYTRFPFQAHLYGLPVPIILDCLNSLFLALKDSSDEVPKNYEQWMYRHFGKCITEYLMVPYAKKIWTINPSKMDYSWIDRRIPQPNFKVILKGALTNNIEKVGFNNDFWYPIKGGIESLPFSFLKKVRNINLNTKATRILPKRKRVEFNGQTWMPYHRLISTLPLPQIISLIENVPLIVKKAAEQLQYNSILCVNLGVNRKNISAYHWLYFHEDEFVFHRISFPMNFSKLTTPEGKSSVSCEIAYSKHRPINKKTIIDRTVKDLIKAGILKQNDIISVSNVLDIKYGYIIYDLYHRKNVDIIHSYLLKHDIHPCGRFGEWEYLNMDHSIMSGKKLAEKLNGLLKKVS